MNNVIARPVPQDAATEKQIQAIRSMTTYAAGLQPWHRHQDDELIEQLNDLLKLDLRAFEELTKQRASEIITKLSNQRT